MRIAMMGSGGLGGFFGGRLAHAGCDVAFIARGEHLHAMQVHGLRIESAAHGDIVVTRARFTDDPAAVGAVDLVIVGVKLWDTETAAKAMRPMVGPATAVLSLQNGVTKDEVLIREFGAAAVMGGVGYVATRVARPGVIEQTGPLQRLVFGEYDGSRSARAEALLRAALPTGIDVQLSTDIHRALWEKFVFLVGLSATTTAMRTPIGPIRANAQTRAFLHDLMKEVVAVGRAHGVNVPENYADERLAFADSVAPGMSSSMHHDLERGSRLELPWLSGAVVELGARVGVPTPLNRAVSDILALVANGRRAHEGEIRQTDVR
jgi:2-dehydropantoate 2-reductase